MAESNCGVPEGVTHLHSDLCWRAGYAAGVADTTTSADPVQNGDGTNG